MPASDGKRSLMVINPEPPNSRFATVELRLGAKPLVALREVRIRVDDTSITTDEGRKGNALGHLGVAGTVAFVNSRHGEDDEIIVDLGTGASIAHPSAGALYFTRWSLVTGNGDSEKLLASFDTTPKS